MEALMRTGASGIRLLEFPVQKLVLPFDPSFPSKQPISANQPNAITKHISPTAKNIFIAAPDNIEVNGDLRDEIMNDDMISPRISE